MNSHSNIEVKLLLMSRILTLTNIQFYSGLSFRRFALLFELDTTDIRPSAPVSAGSHSLLHLIVRW